MTRSLLVLLVFVVLLGGCTRSEEGFPEEGPWTGPITGLIGGPCGDDAYDPGDVLAFTIVQIYPDDFEFTTDEYATKCSLVGRSFTCDPAQVQVAGSAADAILLRTFVFSGELSTNDDMSGEVAFESTCTGLGCTTSIACSLTWHFSAQESG